MITYGRDSDDDLTREQRIDAAEDRADQVALDVLREASYLTDVDCPRCAGSGEVWTGRDEFETGQPITVECPDCIYSTRLP